MTREVRGRNSFLSFLFVRLCLRGSRSSKESSKTYVKTFLWHGLDTLYQKTLERGKGCK